MSAVESQYFALQASWGMTKHMGGRKATIELAELCHINKDTYVLDIGSGVGITAAYLAKKYGCRMMGIDHSEKMIEIAQNRAKKKNLSTKLNFVRADAQNLPFQNNTFDVVISESVNAFMENKQKAINEYARVIKPNGFVGFNEVTWLSDPPEELKSYLSKALGGAKFLKSEEWENLLQKANLKRINARTYQTSAWEQWANELKQMDPRDYLVAWSKFFVQCFKSKEIRSYIKEISTPPKSIFRLFRYFGYGIYVGRKQGF